MKNWYIVQSHSSFENKVAGLIKEEADKAKIGEKFEEIIVPTHDVTEVKRATFRVSLFKWKDTLNILAASTGQRCPIPALRQSGQQW